VTVESGVLNGVALGVFSIWSGEMLNSVGKESVFVADNAVGSLGMGVVMFGK